LILRGWPLAVESAAISSGGGVIGCSRFRWAHSNRSGQRWARAIVADLRSCSHCARGEIRDVVAPKKRRVALAMNNARI